MLENLPLLTANILVNRATRLMQVAGHGHLNSSIWSGSPGEPSGYTAIQEIGGNGLRYCMYQRNISEQFWGCQGAQIKF